ncbi:MAG: ATP-binding protein [Bdellovibrionales bacterium]
MTHKMPAPNANKPFFAAARCRRVAERTRKLPSTCKQKSPPLYASLLAFFVAFLTASAGQADSLGDFGVAPSAPFTNVTSSNAVRMGDLLFGTFMGVMLTASAYLFFIWIVMREKGQAFLLSLLFCLSVYIASTNNVLMGQIGVTSSDLRHIVANYSLIMSCICGVAFTYYFLDVEAHIPSLILPLYIVGGLLCLLLILSIFDQALVPFALPLLSELAIAVIMITGVLSFNRGLTGSLTHMVAFTFLLCGHLADPLRDLGYLGSAERSHEVAYISFSLAALMFAIVIASQFAARQDEKEKALAISNERFTLATRGANEGLFDWNLASGEIFFSEQMRKILGLRLPGTIELLKAWIRLLEPHDRRIVREALRRFRHNQNVNTLNVEYRIYGPKNTKRWLYSKAVAVRDPATKRIVRLVGSTNDVTSRKQGEVALRASEARFRSITEAHPVPVLIVGLRGANILYASPGAEQLLGFPQERLLHSYFDQFLTCDVTKSELWAAMREGREVNLREVRLMKGKEATPLDAALSARRISYQNEDAMVIGLYDLTQRKEAEAQISRQQEALQQSEKMAALGGLLAGVAHELNNPLSVVVGQATLLMDGSSEPKVVSRAEKIYKAADRCSRIVKSFLALARRKPPERKPVSVNSVVNTAMDLLGYQIRTGGIGVTLNLAQELPDIMGDSDQMTQVITNLVINASQAMEDWKGERRMTIATRAVNDADSSPSLIVEIADTGPGVPPEIRSRIFEPFFTTKSGKGGTGVGLSLCLNIVASHGGQLQVQDTQGGGATFLIRLPVATSAARNGSAEGESLAAMLPALRILLVDDELELIQTLADLLEPEGHQIDFAANGAIAFDKLRKANFDVVVSDLRMPVMDGPQLYESIRTEKPEYIDKIIYVTGDTLSSHVQSFLAKYPVPVIEKPYRLSDVRQAIATLLKLAPERSNMGKPNESGQTTGQT